MGNASAWCAVPVKGRRQLNNKIGKQVPGFILLIHCLFFSNVLFIILRRSPANALEGQTYDTIESWCISRTILRIM